MLDLLDIGEAELRVYRQLLRGPTTPSEVATALDAAPDEVGTLLERLTGLGLASRQGGEEVRFVATPPELGVGTLVAERREQLRRAEAELAALSELYRSAGAGRSISDVVDLVPGMEAVVQRVAQVQRAARHEVRILLQQEVLVLSGVGDPEEEGALARGVRYRVVAEQEVASRPGFLAAAERTAPAREVRLAPSLPGRMVVVDSDLVLVPMATGGDPGSVGALLIHEGALLELLATLFEHLWSTAAPLTGHPGAALPDGLDEVDLEVLRLLAAGLADRVVAARLGISVRTLQRRTRVLMDLAGVWSRMQLGMVAARRGWLD